MDSRGLPYLDAVLAGARGAGGATGAAAAAETAEQSAVSAVAERVLRHQQPKTARAIRRQAALFLAAKTAAKHKLGSVTHPAFPGPLVVSKAGQHGDAKGDVFGVDSAASR